MQTLDVPYGSDRFGLICGYHFLPGQAAQAISLEDALRWLAQTPSQAAAEPGAVPGEIPSDLPREVLREAPQEIPHKVPPGPGFVWLHFNLGDAAAERWIAEHLPTVPEFFEALHEGWRSTRIGDAHDTLVAVVNDVAYEFAFDPSQIETLWAQVTPRLALTARVHPLRSIDRLRKAVKDGTGFTSSVEFLSRLLADQCDVLVHIVRQATRQVDEVEDKLLAGRLAHRRVELGQLRRVLVRLQRLLAPEPGALFRLLRLPPPWIGDHGLDELRKATEEFTLVIRDLSGLQERIKLLQEEIAAQLNEQTSRSLFTLTIVTVLALPINIIAGLFGMNVGGIPFSDAPHGFASVVALIAALTAVLAWLAFRQRD